LAALRDFCESMIDMSNLVHRRARVGLVDRLGVCGRAGGIVGAVIGLVLTVLGAVHDSLSLDGSQALWIWLVLTLLGWLVLLFIFTLFVRWTVKSVVLPTLINSMLVAAFTVAITVLTELYSLAWLVGIIVGTVMGMILCWLHRLATRS
jgi:hypothetical protein